MAAIATGLKLKTKPARKLVTTAAGPACSKAKRSESTSTLIHFLAAFGKRCKELPSGGQRGEAQLAVDGDRRQRQNAQLHGVVQLLRSEEHTSELQSLMRTSYAVFCLKRHPQHKP